MAKIPANASPINFGSNDTEAGIRKLGSTVTGTPVASTDIDVLLANVANGLNKNSITGDGVRKLPISGELNGLFFSLFRLLAHLQQNGIQEYNANIEYPAFALAKAVDGEALYQSKVNANQGNALTNTTKWLSLCNISDLAIFAKNQVGDLKLSVLNADHSKFLLCDGRAISRTTYSALFNAIGTSFGVGDNSTTFNIPDFRGRVAGAIGQGSGLTNRTLGNQVGAESETLNINQMPSHFFFTTSSAGVGVTNQTLSSNNFLKQHAAVGQGGMYNENFEYDLKGVDAESSIGKTNTLGQNQSHNNMQPTLFAGNYFIYAG